MTSPRHVPVEIRTVHPATDDETELWFSNGSGTERLAVPAADAYQVMVQELSSVLSGGPGWVLPLEQSRETAACLDQIRAACPR